MVENYAKDIKESVYHGAVVSVLAVAAPPPPVPKTSTER